MNASCTDSHRVCAFRFPCFVFREITASFPIIPSARTVQGVEKGFSTPCKCKSAKAVLHLGHHFLVKWVSKIPHFTARAPSFSEAEGAATLRLPPETRDPPQRGRGAIKKMIEEAVVPTAPRTGKAGSADESAAKGGRRGEDSPKGSAAPKPALPLCGVARGVKK